METAENANENDVHCFYSTVPKRLAIFPSPAGKIANLVYSVPMSKAEKIDWGKYMQFH
jgi:hypothetical protein